MAHWEDELAGLASQRGRALVGYAYLLCGNGRDAEDLVQDALVKVFSRLRGTPGGRGTGGSRAGTPENTVIISSDDGVTHLEAYARRAILTLYLDGYRRRQRWAGLRHMVGQRDHVRGPEEPATARADVTAALAGLSPRQRACVVLRYFEDLTVPQIADELGTAQGTVKRHLSDAMSAMQGVLGAQAPVDGPAPTPQNDPTSRRNPR
jgi:DNA-directed RNA polymerase specialized sigma24 family protein